MESSFDSFTTGGKILRSKASHRPAAFASLILSWEQKFHSKCRLSGRGVPPRMATRVPASSACNVKLEAAAILLLLSISISPTDASIVLLLSLSHRMLPDEMYMPISTSPFASSRRSGGHDQVALSPTKSTSIKNRSPVPGRIGISGCVNPKRQTPQLDSL
jgi:hypothetical protein